MAGENYHHGPEIIRITSEDGVVVDQKMAVTFLVGTAPVHLPHADAPARALYINRPVIIRTRAQAVAAFGPPTTGYSIPEALEVAFRKDLGQGVGTYIVTNVFDPDVHKTGATPDPTKVVAADLVGAIGVDGTRTGLETAYLCYPRFGYFPRRIIAPRFNGLAGVRAKMQEVANGVHGHAVFDMTSGLTIQQAIEARGSAQPFAMASTRAALCYPRLWAIDPVTQEPALQPYSQHFAALWNRDIAMYGPQRSPSNVSFGADVTGTETDIVWMPGRYDTDTNLLNEAGINTTFTRYGAGLHSWGGMSTAWPTTHPEDGFLHAQVVMDAIDDAVLFYMVDPTDRSAVLRKLSLLEERVNAWLATKSSPDDVNAWLYGGNFRFDRKKTTAEELIGEGRLHWKLDRQPIGIMHRATIEASTNLDYVDQALGLIAA